MRNVEIVFDILQWILIFFWVYWLVISFFGLGKPIKLREKIPQKRFLILIPAHNEEKVISSLIENIFHLDYPNDFYDVFVIADNCTDNTASIAKSFGANVIEHTSLEDEPRGKPFAIRYALDELGKDVDRYYDGVAFFDADNLVASNYLKEMNNHLINGDKVVQCYLDSKNPEDNWVTLSYSTSFMYANRFLQLAKTRLGLSNFIGGTGFCVDTKLLREIGWNAKSLTEDLEFSIQCILRGISVNWCHHTRVYDEKPTSFIASCIQRLRWARGHWDVTIRYSHLLIVRSLSKLDLKSLDAFLFLINPGKMVLGAITSMFLLLDFSTNQGWLESIVPMQAWIGLMIYYFIFIAYPMIVDLGQKSIIKIIKSCLSLSIMHYSNVPLYFWGLFTVKNYVWNRTDHSRNIALNEIELARQQAAIGNEVN